MFFFFFKKQNNFPMSLKKKYKILKKKKQKKTNTMLHCTLQNITLLQIYNNFFTSKLFCTVYISLAFYCLDLTKILFEVYYINIYVGCFKVFVFDFPIDYQYIVLQLQYHEFLLLPMD